ncbi:lipase member H-like isoform X1 [Micropterus dolomieu]|uniref:lipase member H-like isoform X1 n=1 Tax=Micropterus dolomieu TaxID=147949 RepID=UPI001E8CBD32|nr:lipase member H-like isoform X1 [Micropterus dolomieu]
MFLWQYLTLLLLVHVQICKALPDERCAEFTDLDLGQAIIGTRLEVRFLVYTRLNGSCGTLVSQSDLSNHPRFNLSRPTTFVIHGYRPNGSPPIWVSNARKLLLARNDINVVIVDWNHGAANVNYFKAVENTRKAADYITAFIEKMQKHGASLSSIHMIGASLGAHISGFIGASLKGSIGRITALDPAGPQFTGTPPEDRLDSTDAQFVDVLHTDIDVLGFRKPLGHIDFYVNGGLDQPGCPKTIFSGESYFTCDHERAVLLYLDSVNGMCVSRAFPCSSYKDFLDGNCLKCDQFGAAGCPVVGYDVTEWKDVLLRLGQTTAFFTTNAKSPFCTSAYTVDMMLANEDVDWGYITVKLYGNGEEAVATIVSNKSAKSNTETKLFAQFDKDIQSVEEVSLKFFTWNIFKLKYKFSVLQIRLTHLQSKERPLCLYDILLQENKEFTFSPVLC